MRTGRVHARHFFFVRVWRQVLVEAGASISRRNIERILRNTVLPVSPSDNRRVDLVAPGLGIAAGLPLFCDVTCVSPVTGLGDAVSGCIETAGGATRRASRHCHVVDYPDVNSSGLARLVSLGVEVFGHWSEDSLWIVRTAARARSAELSTRVRRGTELRLLRRWFGLLGVATQRFCARALLFGSGSDVPSDLAERVPGLADLPEA